MATRRATLGISATSEHRLVRTAIITVAILSLSGCGTKTPNEAPPRTNDMVRIRPQASTIAVPIEARLDRLAAALEREVPRTLWSIDKPDQTCVASNKVKVLFVRIKTPTIKCRIVGQVTRGRLALSGSGRTLVVTIPIHAVVHARDIGGILKQETATADARVQARVQMDIAPDWTPRGKVDLAYRWTAPPKIAFMGQSIDLTEQADQKLKGVVADLERSLPRQLGQLHMRDQVQRAWNAAFTSIQLNRSNPPVWMRVSPRALQYGGYQVTDNRLVLRLGLRAITETYVDDRPPDPPRTPLPPLTPLADQPGRTVFFIPVVADYRQLEPVLLKALTKRSARPFAVPGVGPIFATFNKVTAYGTSNGHIAVGLNLSASDEANTVGKARATVWLTAKPINQPNSRQVAFTQFAVTGSTDRTGGNLVIKLANTPGLSATIAQALTQNFERDYDKLMAKIDRAIQQKREGDFIIRANIEDIRTGSLKASGQGLYLPVWGTGTASITLAPTGR
jgi:predicted small lipoprotein YifL